MWGTPCYPAVHIPSMLSNRWSIGHDLGTPQCCNRWRLVRNQYILNRVNWKCRRSQLHGGGLYQWIIHSTRLQTKPEDFKAGCLSLTSRNGAVNQWQTMKRYNDFKKRSWFHIISSCFLNLITWISSQLPNHFSTDANRAHVESHSNTPKVALPVRSAVKTRAFDEPRGILQQAMFDHVWYPATHGFH